MQQASAAAPSSATTVSKVPRVIALMWPALVALKKMGGSANNEELLAKLIELERIPTEIQNVPHKDGRRTRLEYNLAWTRTFLKKAGAIDNSSRGIWSLTKAGEALGRDEIPKVYEEVRKQYAEGRRARALTADQDDEEPGEEDESAAAEPHWKNQLLDVLRSLSPDAFERLAQRILREAGFIKVEVTGRSGDGGIDGIGVLRVNLLSFQVLFQCKRYQNSVGASAIRDFRGAMVGRSDKGLILTTSSFTPEAKREATRDGAPAIDLIDGDLLCNLLQQYNLGVRTEMVQRMTVDAQWFKAL
jgi:restriction system protein